jgi:diadenylate cyclase
MPAYLYELSKMDGAIVLSKDMKRILLANTLFCLIPDSNQ